MSGPSSDIRVLAFVGEGVFAPVLDSQVLMPLAYIGRQAPHIRRAVLILTSVRFRRDPRVPSRQAAIRAAVPGAQVLFRYRLPLDLPFQRARWARALRAGLQTAAFTGDGPIVLHCRGQLTAAAATLVKRRDPRVRILLDMRGASEDEIKAGGLRGWYLRRSARRTLRLALQDADALNAVSHKLVDHLRATGLLTRDIPMAVVGCCADTQRFYFDPAVRAARRQELQLADRFVICYCGAMSHWQRPDALAATFAAVAQDMPDAHMLIVSREAEPLLAHLRSLGVPAAKVTARAASHDQVASYLMAADVGLLLRENTLTNRVASPVKFAEYLRCGLPVVLTPYIGDFSEFAVRQGVGQTIEFPIRPAEAVAAVRALRTRLATEGDAFRATCSQVAAAHFSWEVQAAQIIRLYEALSA